MNLWLRLLTLLLSCIWRHRLSEPLATSRLRFRVWLHDLDLSFHMNNGRYWTLMDLGRVDLILRSGLWRQALRRRWTPVVSAGEIRFRRELPPFKAFDLETRILGWSDTHLVIEHRFLYKDAVSAIALVRAAFYERAARRYVPIVELLAALGDSVESPPLGPEVQAFFAAEAALRQVTSPDGPTGDPPGLSDIA